MVIYERDRYFLARDESTGVYDVFGRDAFRETLGGTTVPVSGTSACVAHADSEAVGRLLVDQYASGAFDEAALHAARMEHEPQYRAAHAARAEAAKAQAARMRAWADGYDRAEEARREQVRRKLGS